MSSVEILLLGLLAAWLVLLALPRAFGIESACVGVLGTIPTVGDTYVAGFTALGTLGWLLVFVGTLYASIAERRTVVVLLPLAWFCVLVGSALAAAAAVGPAACPV